MVDCYSGPVGTRNVGACRTGKRSCAAGGTWAAICVGEVLPRPETLNGIDDDCNGSVDDGVTPPPPTPELLVSTAAVSVTEGSSGTFAVSLTAQPAANVVATVSSGDIGAATVAPPSLTFTPANYATPQTVTVTGVQDADMNNEAVTVTVSAAGMASRTVSVAVTDDDAPQGIIVSAATVQFCIFDGAVIGVSLQYPPGGNVTVTATPSVRVAVSPSQLTFSPANFATPQELDITGLSAGSATIRLSAPGAPDSIVSVSVFAATAPVCTL